MNEQQQERLVKAFEDIAEGMRRMARSQEGLEQSAKKAVDNLWPDAKQPRQAVVTHVPTEEEVLRQRQTGIEPPGDDWLRELGADQPFIGEREREWIKQHAQEGVAGDSGGDSEQKTPGPETPQDNTGTA